MSSINISENKNFFYKIYPFATENVAEYFEDLKMKRKAILTVGSSADQIFNALLLGAKEITSFDINKYTEKFYNLKKASVFSLTKEQLIEFFCDTNLNKNIYKKIQHKLKTLSYEDNLFWEEIINKEKTSEIISTDILDKKTINKSNIYLQTDKKYKELRNLLKTKEISFIEGNIFNLENTLESKNYDRIILSNVMQYLEEFTPKDIQQLDNLKKTFSELEKHLNAKGIIQFLYLYSFTKNDIYKKDDPIMIRNLEKIYDTLNEENINLKFIDSVCSSSTDAIVTYTKKR